MLSPAMKSILKIHCCNPYALPTNSMRFFADSISSSCSVHKPPTAVFCALGRVYSGLVLLLAKNRATGGQKFNCDDSDDILGSRDYDDTATPINQAVAMVCRLCDVSFPHTVSKTALFA